MNNISLLRVTKISIENLFGCYSHVVPLHLEERVTIIHGPNGVGKTILLRLTTALLSGNLTQFANIPFTRFEVFLSDGSIYGVAKSPPESSRRANIGATFYLRRTVDDAPEEFVISGEQAEIVRLASRIEKETPWLIPTGPDRFLDRRTDEALSALDVVIKYQDYLPSRLRGRAMFEIPAWMKEVQSRVGVHLIEAQRLFRFAPSNDWEHTRWASASTPQYVETVKDYAKDLQRRISETLAAYAKNSQSLDQSFPERLLRGSHVKELDIDDLKARMGDLERKRQQLKTIGLIEADSSYPFDVSALENTDAAQRSVMTLYVADTANKLGVLDSLAQRIELMLSNINRKFNNKSIRISRDQGLTAFSDDGIGLELSSLSSGEQHELVLLYDLLFRVQSNTLVLVDEPELSLHVTWQKSFLPDLLQIVSATAFDVLLATHSPFIVGDRNDLMIPLRADRKPI